MENVNETKTLGNKIGDWVYDHDEQIIYGSIFIGACIYTAYIGWFLGFGKGAQTMYEGLEQIGSDIFKLGPVA